MNKVIHFMRLCLLDENIPLSWGISNIKHSNDRLSFDVLGAKAQGRVEIKTLNDGVTIKFNSCEKYFYDVSEMLLWLDNSIE